MTTYTKFCSFCGHTKPIEEFTKNSNISNYRKQSATHAYCKMCNAFKAREWRQANPSYKGSGKLTKFPKEDRLLVSAIRTRLRDAGLRAKKFNKPSPTVSVDYLYELYLKQDKKCALTDVVLTVEKEHPLCLSLDQIDAGKGYKEGNVQWLAWCVNRAKGDLSNEDFLGMCKAVLGKEQRLSKSNES